MLKIFKKICIAVFIIWFSIITVFLCFGKRTIFSEAERRKTKSLNDFKMESIFNINFSTFLEDWFVDTVPHKDKIVDASIFLKAYKGIDTGIKVIDTNGKTGFNEDLVGIEENIGKEKKEDINSIMIATKSEMRIATISTPRYDELEEKTFDMVDVINSKRKVVVVGENENLRGLNLFTGLPEAAQSMIYNNINSVAKVLKKDCKLDVNIYYMLIPIACAYYLPQQLKNYWIDQKKIINSIYDNLVDAIPVNIYDILYEHKDEDIYLRTDSHWTQRGAYYAGKAFADIAEVNYPSLDDDFVEKKVDGYCSSFYRYTEDYRFVKNAETFYFYEPKNNYDITQTYYYMNAPFGEHIRQVDEHTDFFKYDYAKPGSTSYLVFMGGDSSTTVARIPENKTERRLLLLKDSYGNALAPNLFYSFDEVHIVDFRNFRGNLVQYMTDYDITDILMSCQITTALAESNKYPVLFTQDAIKNANKRKK